MNSKVREENLLINLAVSQAEYAELTNIYNTTTIISDHQIDHLVGSAGKVAALVTELDLLEQDKIIQKGQIVPGENKLSLITQNYDKSSLLAYDGVIIPGQPFTINAKPSNDQQEVVANFRIPGGKK